MSGLNKNIFFIRTVLTNFHILNSSVFHQVITSVSATGDHFVRFQFDSLILNAITLCYNLDLHLNMKWL